MPSEDQSFPVQGNITGIRVQKRDPHRYNIEINGEYACAVHEDVLVRHRIMVGQSVAYEQWQLWMEEEEKHAVERTALRYIGYRPRTVWEMKQYLLAKGYAPLLVEEVLQNMMDKGYVDDDAFARQWVDERLKRKHKGKYVLQRELQQKGIDEQIITDVLGRMDTSVEVESCLQLARKKAGNLFYQAAREETTVVDREQHAGGDQEQRWQQKQKLYRYLQGRGFSLEVIDEAYRRLHSGDE